MEPKDNDFPTLKDKISEVIRRLVKEKEYSELNVDIEILDKPVNKQEPCFEISSNADFSIPNSIACVARLNELLNANTATLEKYLNTGQQLVINLKFSKKTKEEMNAESIENNPVMQFTPIEPKRDMSQLIISDELRANIENAISILQNQDLIYKEWGFGKIDPSPKSVLSFYGPAGTGKTMCAECIAKKLGKKLLAPKYSEIESKYLGESTKNLKAVFETAKKEDCVLLFDEADSYLDKRITNVSQGSDQALNSFRSQMLIQLEEFSGVVIFATNMAENYDGAFKSRILDHIRFELPNLEARAEIIKAHIPNQLPLKSPMEQSDYLKLSSLIDGFSGREIKNAVLDALLTKAAAQGRKAIFTLEDFEKSFIKKKEMKDKMAENDENKTKSKILNALKNGNSLNHLEH